MKRALALWLLLLPVFAGAVCQTLAVEPKSMNLDIGNYQAPTNYSFKLYITEDPVAIGERCSARFRLSSGMPPGISLIFGAEAVGSANIYTNDPIIINMTISAKGAAAPQAFSRVVTVYDQNSNLSDSLLLNFRVGLTVTPSPASVVQPTQAPRVELPPELAKSPLLEKLNVLLDWRVLVAIILIMGVIVLSYLSSRKARKNHKHS
ncbi:MAG TPA: hypothetical protein VGQ00_04435 [Candidatus Norongarragalinales archaeon]|jgi:hypothetical protein|nr:hypothetical protein [Candidatus Norongarragalinales archaeon]